MNNQNQIHSPIKSPLRSTFPSKPGSNFPRDSTIRAIRFFLATIVGTLGPSVRLRMSAPGMSVTANVGQLLWAATIRLPHKRRKYGSIGAGR